MFSDVSNSMEIVVSSFFLKYLFSGMNVEKFRNAWGGEDWDFAERVLKAGLEIERLRVPYLFHYFHTKKGMWDGKA